MSHSYTQTMAIVHLMDHLTIAYGPMRLASVLLMQHVMEYPAINVIKNMGKKERKRVDMNKKR